ncbi:hypothetical protein PAPYR_3690 [Paratrimastix pyriformis]|uniref:Pre-rRNA-processing protein TSR2 homolog n=1 Tax=Paratrimastix pyriformis TaxID=342808 RepID=A0ABQ8UM76_9EUKA|nr:hypothetical protein PAPYR_3690 [Paratrimastix pyriformis]
MTTLNPVSERRFLQGVRAVLNSWSALRLAVEQGWSGDEEATEKRLENLYLDVIECFLGKTREQFDEDDLLSYLEDHISEEFKVSLEGDVGVEEVERAIGTLFFECLNGQFTKVDRILTQVQRFKPMAPFLDPLNLPDPAAAVSTATTPASSPSPATALSCSTAASTPLPPSVATTPSATPVATATTPAPSEATPVPASDVAATPAQTSTEDEWEVQTHRRNKGKARFS